MKGMTLYEISTRYEAALDELTDSDLPEEVVRDTLEGLTGELREKAINVAAYFANLDQAARAIKRAEDDMKARRQRIQRRAQWLRDYLLTNMQRTGLERIESPYFDIKIVNNPPATEITDEAAVPDEFRQTQTITTIDRLAIRQALKNGTDIHGARLTHSQRVDIK